MESVQDVIASKKRALLEANRDINASLINDDDEETLPGNMSIQRRSNKRAYNEDDAEELGDDEDSSPEKKLYSFKPK